MLVNDYLHSLGKGFITRSAVNVYICWMLARRMVIVKVKQGSIDPLLQWKMSRNNWVHQLLLCLGKIHWDVYHDAPPPLPTLTQNLYVP